MQEHTNNNAVMRKSAHHPEHHSTQDQQTWNVQTHVPHSHKQKNTQIKNQPRMVPGAARVGFAAAEKETKHVLKPHTSTQLIIEGPTNGEISMRCMIAGDVVLVRDIATASRHQTHANSQTQRRHTWMEQERHTITKKESKTSKQTKTRRRKKATTKKMNWNKWKKR